MRTAPNAHRGRMTQSLANRASFAPSSHFSRHRASSRQQGRTFRWHCYYATLLFRISGYVAHGVSRSLTVDCALAGGTDSNSESICTSPKRGASRTS